MRMSKKPLLWFLCLCGLTLLLNLFLANKCGAADDKIISFEIVGNQTVSTDRIMLLVQARTGQTYSEDVLSEDVKRLLATGLFGEVVPQVETAADGVKITVRVKENPGIKEIVFTGNRRYNRKLLQKECGLTAGQLYDKIKASEARDKVEDFYLKKGFLFTEVELDTTELSPTQIRLNFKIKEGVIARVTKITISGNKAIKRSKIAKILTIKERNLLLFRTGTFKQEALDNDRQQIENIYKKAGYADVKVTSEAKRYKKTLEVIHTIEEGERYLLGSTSLSGNLIVPEAGLRKLLSKKTGEIGRAHV